MLQMRLPAAAVELVPLPCLMFAGRAESCVHAEGQHVLLGLGLHPAQHFAASALQRLGGLCLFLHHLLRHRLRCQPRQVCMQMQAHRATVIACLQAESLPCLKAAHVLWVGCPDGLRHMSSG